MITEKELVHELAKKENRNLTRKLFKLNKSKQLFLEVSNTGAYEGVLRIKMERMSDDEIQEIVKRIEKK